MQVNYVIFTIKSRFFHDVFYKPDIKPHGLPILQHVIYIEKNTTLN